MVLFVGRLMAWHQKPSTTSQFNLQDLGTYIPGAAYQALLSQTGQMSPLAALFRQHVMPRKLLSVWKRHKLAKGARALAKKAAR